MERLDSMNSGFKPPAHLPNFDVAVELFYPSPSTLLRVNRAISKTQTFFKLEAAGVILFVFIIAVTVNFYSLRVEALCRGGPFFTFTIAFKIYSLCKELRIPSSSSLFAPAVSKEFGKLDA